MKITVFLLSTAPVLAQIITYTKSFPGSTPAWVEVSVQESGEAVYKEDPKDELPVRFTVNDIDRVMLRSLAEKLDKFSRPLESSAKVAKMGMKTLRYEKDGERHETKFNYSEDLDARALQDWFERVIETEQERIQLERTARYEKLGVEDALLRIEVSWDRKRLVAPEQFLPLLDRITKNDSYMHMARSRAAGLAEHIRGTVK